MLIFVAGANHLDNPLARENVSTTEIKGGTKGIQRLAKKLASLCQNHHTMKSDRFFGEWVQDQRNQLNLSSRGLGHLPHLFTHYRSRVRQASGTRRVQWPKIKKPLE